MHIKLIASDLDDTLLGPDGQLSQRTVDALKAAMARGTRVVLASGRRIESMFFASDRIRPNAPLIAYNGGAVYDPDAGQIIMERLVPAGDARELCALAESLGLHVQGFSGNIYEFAEDNEYSRDYGNSISQPGVAVHKKLSEHIAVGQNKLLVIDSAERIAEVKPLFQERFAGRVHCITSKPTYLECVAPGVDKGSTLSWLCARLGIDPVEVMAFGDGQNDLEMLDFAGHGYVMANANDEVKSRIPLVAPPNGEDGVAQVIEQWIAEGRIGS